MAIANAKMTDHVCNVRKGPPTNWRLTYSAGLDASVSGLHDGSLVSLNADGKFVLGCAAGDGKNIPMPMWALQDEAQPGVLQIGNNAFAGIASAVVATGGFEIETSEFDATATYAFNDALMPSASAAGKVTKATTNVYGANPIVGVVSQKPYVNGVTGTQVIGFWSTFIPAAGASA